MHRTVRGVATSICVVGCLLAGTAAAQPVESGAELGAPPSDDSATEEPLAPPREPPRLIVLSTEGNDELVTMVRTQLPGWDVERRAERPTVLTIERIESTLRAEDALLWLEREEAVVHVVVSGREGRALSSPIPADASGEDLARVYALAAVGLLNELWAQRRRLEAYEQSAARIRNRELDELRERHEQDVQSIAQLSRARESLREEVATRERRRRRRWRSPLSPRGVAFRFGWVHGFSPRHEYYETWGRPDPSVWAWPTLGLRVSLAARFDGRVLVGGSVVSLHAGGLWNGSLNGFVSVHSKARIRLGLTAEAGLLIAKENDENSEIETSWASVRLYFPFEIGVAVNQHGGVFVKVGPLVTRAPDSWFVGYDISVEWEFD